MPDRDAKTPSVEEPAVEVLNPDVTGDEKSVDRARRNAIFDSARDFAMVVTDSTGAITSWNVGAEQVMGWTAEEMRGQHISRCYTPEDCAVEAAATEMQLALRDGQASDERWHLRKTGSRFWASGEMIPLRDDAGRHIGFVKILRDRTAEHEAGDAMVESERRHRSLAARSSFEKNLVDAVVDQAPVGISIAFAEEGAMPIINAAMQAILGHGAAGTGTERYKAYGAVHADGRRYSPEDYPTVRALTRGEQIEHELTLYRMGSASPHLEGSIRRLELTSRPVRDPDGRILAAVTIAEDIEERYETMC